VTPKIVVQVTFVTPTGKVVPEAGVHVTGRGPSTKSTADAAYFTTVPSPALAATVMLPGMAMPGARVSGAFFDSLTSKQPTSPSPTWSSGHGEHVRDPSVFRQSVRRSQPPLPLVHSLRSTQPVAGVPLNPAGQLAPQRQPPSALAHLASPQPPFSIAPMA